MPTITLTKADADRVNALELRSGVLPDVAEGRTLTPLEVGRLHDQLHDADPDLYYGSGNDLHDRLSDAVFNRI